MPSMANNSAEKPKLRSTAVWNLSGASESFTCESRVLIRAMVTAES